jgi:hypothetical protein
MPVIPSSVGGSDQEGHPSKTLQAKKKKKKKKGLQDSLSQWKKAKNGGFQPVIT